MWRKKYTAIKINMYQLYLINISKLEMSQQPFIKVCILKTALDAEEIAQQ